MVEVPEAAALKGTNRAWTEAVYGSLMTFRQERGWDIFPSEKCYRGEYHCDFTLFEKGYGCRLACESQWQTFRSHPDELEWAFDKLRGIKSDVKLFIFEASDSWKDEIRKYLEGYAQLDPSETFVFMRWNAAYWECFWWKPTVVGKQTEAFSPTEC
jgi:hypothetical protein